MVFSSIIGAVFIAQGRGAGKQQAAELWKINRLRELKGIFAPTALNYMGILEGFYMAKKKGVSPLCVGVVAAALNSLAAKADGPDDGSPRFSTAAAGQFTKDMKKGAGPYDSAGLSWGVAADLGELRKSQDKLIAGCARDVEADLKQRGVTGVGLHGVDDGIASGQASAPARGASGAKPAPRNPQ